VSLSASSVWSLGCVLYELLTLSAPYTGIPDGECERFITSGVRPIMQYHSSSIPKEHQQDPVWKGMVSLFEACTVLDPSSRPSAEQILAFLTQITDSNSITTMEVGKPEEDRESLERKLVELKAELHAATTEKDFDRAAKLTNELQAIKKQLDSVFK
jgi:serine/threonine protein kinase